VQTTMKDNPQEVIVKHILIKTKRDSTHSNKDLKQLITAAQSIQRIF